MVSKPLCPKCRKEIPLDDVNVAKDIALCRRCGESWAFSDLLESVSARSVDLANPPRGAWFVRHPPLGFEVGASTRSGAALFLIPFLCVWSGFSLGGIYGSQIHKRQFDLMNSLFGIPFLLGTAVLSSLALMSICGKVVVRVAGDEAVIFVGVGPIGWRRRCNWRKVSSIKRTEKLNNGNTSQRLTIEGEKRIDFGTGLKSERQDFMLGALQQMRAGRGGL